MKPTSRRRFHAAMRKTPERRSGDRSAVKAQQCGSLPILIGRELEQARDKRCSGGVNAAIRKHSEQERHSETGNRFFRSAFTVRFLRRVEGSGASGERKQKRAKRRETGLREIPVTMARGFHLYPYRTQKLSLLAPKVLDWKRSGRIGRRREPMRG